MIEINDLSKQFGDRVIFKDFNLQIEDGEKVAIIGTSGCGKSTLLDMMIGIDQVSSGKISIYNYLNPKIGKTKPYFYSHIISLIMQDYGLVSTDTVLDSLKIGEPKVTNEQAINVLGKVGLKIKLKDKIYELSGGEKQRVAIARVLIKPSKVILCDEPTGNLDNDTASDIEELILSLDKTVVIVTHDLEFANKCDRIIELK